MTRSVPSAPQSPLAGVVPPKPAAPISLISLPARETLREHTQAATRLPETDAVMPLLSAARLSAQMAADVQALAERLAAGVRRQQTSGLARGALVQGLLQEFSLSSQEGIALMCLAEALLRIPDPATRDALIRDKLASGRWREHIGHHTSPFVNAAAWGLWLTGQLIGTHSEHHLLGAVSRIVAKGGEPLVRRAVDAMMRVLGEHFVTGRTIDEALHRARVREAQGFRYSFDMLGEAAMTADDARRYAQAYQTAIDEMGRARANNDPIHGPGISIKLSALHPRYAVAQRARVFSELYPVLLGLARRARDHHLGLNIDAEEADRLELSLDLFARLCEEPDLAGWHGLGFVVQAYQKRCPMVIDELIALGRRTDHRLMVRLVKGAYWDSEIKRAQVDGLDDYPVYTRKAHTDVAYIACARRLLAASDAVYPQFATHNARTVATIHQLADPENWTPDQYEFQCLHGMGESLYQQVVAQRDEGGLGRPCRIYAPVGTHETLLAYLVRRLLENGANTSFVHQIADPSVPLADLVRDPVEIVETEVNRGRQIGSPHPKIALPCMRGGTGRLLARGLDLADERVLVELDRALADSRDIDYRAAPTTLADVAPDASSGEGGRPSPRAVTNPALRDDIVGHVVDASLADVNAALSRAEAAAMAWAARPVSDRAQRLREAATQLEQQMPALIALLIREAGKTAANAVAEVREAVDFLRYYAGAVDAHFDAVTHQPLGIVTCISPWNFPLAIFIGQVSAALAAGNVVIAKPAEQTPLIASEAVRLLHDAGIPNDVLQLVPGPGETVGAALVADPRVAGVVFTGSGEVARLLQRQLAERADGRQAPIPLIAETGGQNAMIIDSSALPEQVVADVLASACDSAGQRCSALRVLCLQEDVAARVLPMLEGAMAELSIGRPERLSTDVGPLIDDDARTAITMHINAMRARGHRVVQPSRCDPYVLAAGSFVPPTLIEIDSICELEREVFGPVLHVVRYRRDALDELLTQIANAGFGLTMGVHSRIDETISQVRSRSLVGNLYVNRNIIGAVVGVQPFGGQGLSGTGPKAGGPLYLSRLLASRPDEAIARQLSLAAEPAAIAPTTPEREDAAQTADAKLELLAHWADAREFAGLAELCRELIDQVPVRDWVLPGPTGERNTYCLQGRQRVLCLAHETSARLRQLAVVLAVGGRVLWQPSAADLRSQLPVELQQSIDIAPVSDLAKAGEAGIDLVLFAGHPAALATCARRLALSPGPVIGLARFGADGDPVPYEQLFVERVVSVNTAAAGGNASLMTID